MSVRLLRGQKTSLQADRADTRVFDRVRGSRLDNLMESQLIVLLSANEPPIACRKVSLRENFRLSMGEPFTLLSLQPS
jgi:hypothetical protein